MRIAAIIAEYNPFHTGHQYHIRQTRALSGADYVVAIMGGNFTQRGESAILDKRTRAEAALRGGADAVIELPGLFTVRAADGFAAAGVAIAEGIGADVLSFGCEDADLSLLHRILDAEESAQDAIRRELTAGKSYARARGEAIAAQLNMPAEDLNRPNLVLGLEYLRAIRRTNANIRPMPVQRLGEYHSGEMTVPFPSASAIRAAARNGENVFRHLPGLSPETRFMQPMDALDPVFLYAIRNMQPDAMANICDFSEGLEHRVCKLSTRCTSRMQLLDELKCKRYTMAHLSRLLTQAVTGMTKPLAAAHPQPEYARILGIRRGAEPLLKELSARARLPLVTDAAQLKGNPIFEYECRMTDLFMLLASNPAERLGGRECTARFIRADISEAPLP